MGKYSQAVECLEQLQKSLTEPAASDYVSLTNWLYLALAHQQLGHAGEASVWLQRANQRLDQEFAVEKPSSLRLGNQAWAMCLVLRREAEGLAQSRGQGVRLTSHYLKSARKQ